MSYLGLRTWDPCEVPSPSCHTHNGCDCTDKWRQLPSSAISTVEIDWKTISLGPEPNIVDPLLNKVMNWG